VSLTLTPHKFGLFFQVGATFQCFNDLAKIRVGVGI
jgi:hypothetical protein